VLYAAYFDASTARTDFPVLTVAGAVAPIKKWTRFKQQWRTALANEDVSEFHATDCHASKGDYRTWKGDPARRGAFLRGLQKIIKDNCNKLFIASVELAPWAEVNQEYCLEEFFHSPYALAGRAVVEGVLEWAKRKGTVLPQIIFEHGDTGWEGLVELCARLNVVPIRLPKRLATPCQVGDFLAWKTRITATNALRGLDKLERKAGHCRENAVGIIREVGSLNMQLVRPVKNGIFSSDTLRRNCVKFKIPKRKHLTDPGEQGPQGLVR